MAEKITGRLVCNVCGKVNVARDFQCDCGNVVDTMFHEELVKPEPPAIVTNGIGKKGENRKLVLQKDVKKGDFIDQDGNKTSEPAKETKRTIPETKKDSSPAQRSFGGKRNRDTHTFSKKR